MTRYNYCAFITGVMFNIPGRFYFVPMPIEVAGGFCDNKRQCPWEFGPTWWNERFENNIFVPWPNARALIIRITCCGMLQYCGNGDDERENDIKLLYLFLSGRNQLSVVVLVHSGSFCDWLSRSQRTRTTWNQSIKPRSDHRKWFNSTEYRIRLKGVSQL